MEIGILFFFEYDDLNRHFSIALFERVTLLFGIIGTKRLRRNVGHCFAIVSCARVARYGIDFGVRIRVHTLERTRDGRRPTVTQYIIILIYSHAL